MKLARTGIISIRPLRTWHFSVDHLFKKIQKVFRHRQRHTNAPDYSSLSSSVSVSREVGKAEVYLSIPNPHLGKQICANRLNVLASYDADGIVAELNHFSSHGFTHRQIVLLVGENGEAYDMAGRKWSRSA